jgi:hypothetical protein
MATEIIAIAGGVNVVHARQFTPVAADLAAIEAHALVVVDPVAVFDPNGVAAAIVDAREVAVAMILAFDALRLLVPAVGLKVCKATLTAAAALDTLHLTLAAATLDCELTALTAAIAPFHAHLTLTAAALHLERALATATTALHALHLTASAAAALCFLAAAPLLGLRVTAMSAALFGLGGCRNGYRKCRDTGCKDELAHHESPIGSQLERPCYGPVPLLGTEWERPTAPG